MRSRFHRVMFAGAGLLMLLDPLPNVFASPLAVEGMTFRHRFVGDSIEFEFEAPASGWIAVGFNSKDDIVGADLKMFAVTAAGPVSSDQFVVAAGRHPEKRALGAASNLETLELTELRGRTRARFRTPVRGGRYDFTFEPGREIWLILAWSAEDDFAHHSRVRRHFRYRL